MNSLWNSFKIAFSMFSKIPMPRADWTKENMRYMFCFFPFIGIVIGGLTILTAYLGNYFGFQKEFVTIVLVLIPVLVTGGIHVDGLLDTSDAMSSWQERKRRLEILKDPNAGAFAVITACVYFLCWYAAYSQLNGKMEGIYVMSIGFVLSRCLSGLGVITLPKAKVDGTVAEFSQKAEDKTVKSVLLLYLVLAAGLMIWLSPILGVCSFGVSIGIYGYYRYMALKYFGGTTGDLSGYFLCLCEVGIALALAILSNFVL